MPQHLPEMQQTPTAATILLRPVEGVTKDTQHALLDVGLITQSKRDLCLHEQSGDRRVKANATGNDTKVDNAQHNNAIVSSNASSGEATLINFITTSHEDISSS